MKKIIMISSLIMLFIGNNAMSYAYWSQFSRKILPYAAITAAVPATFGISYFLGKKNPGVVDKKEFTIGPALSSISCLHTSLIIGGIAFNTMQQAFLASKTNNMLMSRTLGCVGLSLMTACAYASYNGGKYKARTEALVRIKNQTL